MAAPSDIVWGSVVTGSKSTRKGRIGIYLSKTVTDTQVKVAVQVWFYSMYSVDDVNNTFTYNGTSMGSRDINHTVDSGSGWDTKNQTLLYSTTDTYNRATSASTKTYTAKFTGLETLGTSSVMTDSKSVTIDALSTYTVTYNANGGSGAPAKQTKYRDKSITLSSTKPTRSGYVFSKWNTNSSGTGTSYSPGATYSGNASITLYAIWSANTYTITYDANGGSGAPAKQTKNHDASITLSSTKPTRTNYTFKGWAVSTNGSVSYNPGATYSANANLTLYAVWELTYKIPKVYDLSVSRSTSNGTISDDGTSMVISFSWETELSVKTIKVAWEDVKQSGSYTTISASGVSGTVTNAVVGVNKFDVEKTYTITVTVSDANGTSIPATVTLPGATFILDILSTGKGIAFGKAAEVSDSVDFGWEAIFNKPVSGKVVGMDRLPRLASNTDINSLLDTGCYSVRMDTEAATMPNLPVPYAGRLEVYNSVGGTMSAESYSYIRQRFTAYTLNWGIWERDIWRLGDNNWTYYEWKCTSSPRVVLFDGNTDGAISLPISMSKFEYIEIFFTDNNGIRGGYTKLHYPYKSTVDLSIIEAASSSATYIRRTRYTLTENSITPNTSNAGYVSIVDGTVSRKDASINRIKITRVVGYHV